MQRSANERRRYKVPPSVMNVNQHQGGIAFSAIAELVTQEENAEWDRENVGVDVKPCQRAREAVCLL